MVNVQALGDRTNPSVLWLKYALNINKNGIFVIQLYFFIFSVSKNITAHFSTVEKGSYFDPIDSVKIPELGDEGLMEVYLLHLSLFVNTKCSHPC